LVSPVTVSGLEVPETVAPPGDAVTRYEVIADPPFDAGAVKRTTAWVSPAVPDTPVGAPGTARGVTAFEAGDAGLGPTPLVDLTVNV